MKAFGIGLVLLFSMAASCDDTNKLVGTETVVVDDEGECDEAYINVCIPPYPPDLDCGDIGERRFRVVPPDPHGFDAEPDGIGCELD